MALRMLDEHSSNRVLVDDPKMEMAVENSLDDTLLQGALDEAALDRPSVGWLATVTNLVVEIVKVWAKLEMNCSRIQFYVHLPATGSVFELNFCSMTNLMVALQSVNIPTI